MNIKDYVDSVLEIPITRIGYRFIVEAIEIVIDSHDRKFYKRLSEVTGYSLRYIEKAMRTAKDIGFETLTEEKKIEIFGKSTPITTSEFILRSAEYYRRNYEDKKE